MDETASVHASLDWLQEIFKNWVRWVREHLLITLLLSAVAFALGWVWNTYVMAVGLEGSQPVDGQRTIATAEGRPFNALFWLLLFSLLSGLATYVWQRGWKHTLQDFGVLPRRFVDALRTDKGSTAALLLWGAAVALITASLITSAVSLALGLVLVTLAATPVGVIVNFAVVRLWRGLTGVAEPQSNVEAAALSAPFLVMVGEAFGLFVDWGADSWLFSLVAGVLLGGGSLVLARRGQGVVAGMFVLGMVWLVGVARSDRAWADDGGWSECFLDSGELCSEAGFEGLLAWFGSPGASTVMAYASIGGVFSATGAALGMGLGAAAAMGVASSPPPGSTAADRKGAGGPSAHPAEFSTATTDSDRDVGPGSEASPDADAEEQAAAEAAADRRTAAGLGAADAAAGVGDHAVGMSAEVPDVLPEPPDRSTEAGPTEAGSTGAGSTDATGSDEAAATAADDEARAAPTTPEPSPPGPPEGGDGLQGPPSMDFEDVLPEPPDEDEDEEESEEK